MFCQKKSLLLFFFPKQKKSAENGRWMERMMMMALGRKGREGGGREGGRKRGREEGLFKQNVDSARERERNGRA